MASALLMVAIVGAVAVARGYHKSDRTSGDDKTNMRLGPVSSASPSRSATAAAASTGDPALAHTTKIESEATS